MPTDLGECHDTNGWLRPNDSLESSLTRQIYDSKFFGTTFFTLAYTYGRAIDNSSGFQNRTSQVPFYNINQFRGAADFDVQHRVVFSGGWDLPFDRAWKSGSKYLTKGWSLYPVFSWRNGFPLSIPAQLYGGFASIDTPGPSAEGDPAIVNAIFAPGFTKIPITNPRTNGNVYFNASAFTNAQSADTVGNCSAISPNEFPSDAQAVNCPSLRTYGLPRNFFRQFAGRSRNRRRLQSRHRSDSRTP